MSYYNTTNLKNPTLFDSIEKSINQDSIILSYFETFNSSLLSPCDVWKALFKNTAPLTSVRRSISSLTASGHLIKTDQFKTGIFGKKVYLWKYKLENKK